MPPAAIPPLIAPPGYCPQASDTSPETDLLTFYLLRQRSPLQRWQMADALIRDARRLSLAGLQNRFSHLSPSAFARKVAQAWLQDRCPPSYQPLNCQSCGVAMTWIQDSSSLAASLHAILSSLEIPYYITGGVAAIIYGEPRTTRDVDIVLSVATDKIDDLVRALEAAGFYVPGVEDLKSGRMQTLGITQMETIARADLVLAKVDDPWEQLKFERRQGLEVPGAGELFFASAEDVVLNKLRWGQRSQSEKQWRDVLGVLKVQGESLDRNYLTRWGEKLNLSAAIAQALQEAGLT